MTKLKVLLLGSAGMAGHVLKNELLKLSEKIDLVDIARSDRYTRPIIKMDITNFVSLGDLVANSNFDYVINSVGILNKSAEEYPDNAVLINSYLPHFLEKITKNTDTRIIHISTDCVFSGKKGSYLELDFKDGEGFYAQTKALGELNNDKDLTIRTSIIGPDLNPEGIGLFNWFINQNGLVKGFSNAIWSGVTTIQLAKSIIEIIFSTNKIFGLVHLTNNEKISKYNLLLLIKEIFELKEIIIQELNSYHVDKSLINTHNDIFKNIPTYNEMIFEMLEWIKINNPKKI
jgi:dTDP-4-dehydrorhamnose reductase